MRPSNRHDEFLSENEFPTERDVEKFGDESPWDNDALTIGMVGKRKKSKRGFWTRQRIMMALIMLVIIAAIVLPLLVPLLRGL